MPYQLQAAIAAIHDEALTADETDWPQILALYDVLEQVSPGPVVTLNRAVAVAMVARTAGRARPARDPRRRRPYAVTRTGSTSSGDTCSSSRATAVAARESYLLAARMTASVPEQRYLALRAARLG